jgi:hypothetical protein
MYLREVCDVSTDRTQSEDPFEANSFKGTLLERPVYEARKILLQDNFGEGEELSNEQHIMKKLAIPNFRQPTWTLTWYHPARSWVDPSIPDIVVEHLGRHMLQEEAKNWGLEYRTTIGHFESHIAARFANQPTCPNRHLVISRLNITPDSVEAIKHRLTQLSIKVLELGQLATEDNYDEILQMLLERSEFASWLDNLALPTRPEAPPRKALK